MRRLVVCLALLALALGACDSPAEPDENGEQPQLPACVDPLFTVLPVAESDFDAVAVFGGLGAPGHTLPTAHSGLHLTREGATVVAPGDIVIDELREVTYLGSPSREEETDYAIMFDACQYVHGWFGHVTSLHPSIADGVVWDDCLTYQTADETVRNCFADLNLSVKAGDTLGTAGMSIERGLMALDFGLFDDRVTNFYISAWRFPSHARHAVCPYTHFDDANRALLFSRIRDLTRPGGPPGDPNHCGTMEVDVPGTARGVWADPAVTTPAGGDERRYITLANNPYSPQHELALSLGLDELGAQLVITPRATAGRVNRAFEQVTNDGLIYCYTSSDPWGLSNSWFLSLEADESLRMERLQHEPGASPCDDDPSTWSFSAASVTLVR